MSEKEQAAIPHTPNQSAAVNSASLDLVHCIKLIRKLRWIGMEEEAKRMQEQVSALPSEKRGVVAEQPSTD